ncbi:uncharacterized protein [Palaemon carinicauda]|uniref:uncharacterized protein n=1 Tax=Palaemon carinicauda TaxID=392227 RepID=UPI0035B65903
MEMEISTKRDEVLKIAEDFYTMLYKSDIRNKFANKNDGNPKLIPNITIGEENNALKDMKRVKAAREDGLKIGLIIDRADFILVKLVEPYTKFQQECSISSLSAIYNIFANIILGRIERQLDFNQPREQAGFRSRYSTTDHMHGEYSNLSFSDDIVVLSELWEEFGKIIEYLNSESKNVGLEINIIKTKIMFNEKAEITQIRAMDERLEIVSENISLGQKACVSPGH